MDRQTFEELAVSAWTFIQNDSPLLRQYADGKINMLFDVLLREDPYSEEVQDAALLSMVASTVRDQILLDGMDQHIENIDNIVNKAFEPLEQEYGLNG